jgi:hypothetical protein
LEHRHCDDTLELHDLRGVSQHVVRILARVLDLLNAPSQDRPRYGSPATRRHGELRNHGNLGEEIPQRCHVDELAVEGEHRGTIAATQPESTDGYRIEDGLEISLGLADDP